MQSLQKIIAILFVLSVGLNLIPEYFKGINLHLYYFIDLLPLRLLCLLYLVLIPTKHYNVLYLLGLIALMIGEFIGKYYDNYYGIDVALNGLCFMFYCIVLRDSIVKLSMKSILIVSVPFLVLITFSYLYFDNVLDVIGDYAVNFYLFAMGLYILTVTALYVNEKSKPHLYLLLCALFAVITSILNALYINNYSVTIERFINLIFISCHAFMFLYMYVSKSDTMDEEQVLIQ